MEVSGGEGRKSARVAGRSMAPGERVEAALRLLRGEPIEALSRELGVERGHLERWRERALAGIEDALREADDSPAVAVTGASPELQPGQTPAPADRPVRACAHCGQPLVEGPVFVSVDGQRSICADCFEEKRFRVLRKKWLREQLVRGAVVLLVAVTIAGLVYLFQGLVPPPQPKRPSRPVRRTSAAAPADLDRLARCVDAGRAARIPADAGSLLPWRQG